METRDGLLHKKYSTLQNVGYCLKNTARCYPPLFFWCALAVAINIALPLLTTFLPQAVLSVLTEKQGISLLLRVTLGFTLSIALLSGLKHYCEKNVYWNRFKMNAFYLRLVARKGLTTDYPHQENERFRKLQSESFNSCNGNYSPLTQVYDILIALLSGLLGFVVYFGILAQLNLFVVLFLAVTTVVSYYLSGRLVKWVEAHNAEKIAFGQRTGYISDVSGDLRSAKDISLYGMVTWLNRIYHLNLLGLSDWTKRYGARVFGVTLADSGLSLLREGVAYAYLVAQVLSGKMGVADFVLYFGVITGFSVWLNSLLGQVSALNRISFSFDCLRNFLEFPEDFAREGGKATDGLSGAPRTIEMRNVSYRYAGAEKDTLHNVSLTLHPGEHLAVVGLNGAGKTTLVKLLCGLTDPTEGQVLYDGVDVRDYDRTAFYRLFSAVFQQNSLLPVAVESIVAEKTEGQIDAARVRACLAQAGLLERIDALPKGAKTPYGKTVYDEGVDFSGGEIQKLLLARALYKNAPVMLLDEPTAALDPLSESRMYEIYHEIVQGKTAVFISHRLASTRFCSRILMLEDGGVIEEGTHESLLAQKGRYYTLFETQAKYYREHPEGEEAAQ